MPLNNIYKTLQSAYGAQHWWPAESSFEMMVGAILTQNTSWTNVEKAITNLKKANALDASVIVSLDQADLCEMIRPAGFFIQKARYLKNIGYFFLEFREYIATASCPDNDIQRLRQLLLSLKGVGPETADSILLYAFNMPVFVIDAYTRRIFSRLGLISSTVTYAELQQYFHRHVVPDSKIYNEYHALIVRHAKTHCRSKDRKSVV